MVLTYDNRHYCYNTGYGCQSSPALTVRNPFFLDSADGSTTMQAYHKMCALFDSPRKLATLRIQLLTYCKQDTLAMVRLLETVQSVFCKRRMKL